VLVADFTTLVLAATQSLASLSVALGVAAVRLSSLTLDQALAGVETELSGTLTAAQQADNLALASSVYERVRDWAPIQERSENLAVTASPLVEVACDPPGVAAPSIYAVGNSPERRTGNWRQFRPVLQRELCTRCWICFVRCPEAAITLDGHDYPVVNYDECKGCLLCVHECPTHAFTAEKESR
jgi:pyruvate ferredoxin oxidoreductase gamma subunit